MDTAHRLEKRVVLKTCVASWSSGGRVISTRTERSEVRVLLSAGLRLVLEKDYLNTFLRCTHALKECPALGSKRSCPHSGVMSFISFSSVSSDGNLVGIDLSGNPRKALRTQ
ncbi:hypothetical protein ElyMa_006505400 [Elysia marginata]|uniref:Rieske domain-containing protein n=1 Tax=Elysia marginata TaxID=1093978 RepID=A0AAV4I453_9GAST|nr:hypothetical protein ElyMa_006505400 [Elysia marginata]